MLLFLKLLNHRKGRVHIINDVPLMDPITPHCVSLGLLKISNTFKIYTFAFYDYLNNNKFNFLVYLFHLYLS